MSSADSATPDVATPEQKMIELQSSDGKMFIVDENVAVLSVTLKNMIEDGCANNVIPIPNVTGEILAKVIEYCKRHPKPEDEEKDEDAKAFDVEFVKVDQRTLFDLVLAANYLNIKGLLDLTCKTVADMMKDKSVEKIREIFNIKNDFTEEEDEELRKENAWAFE